MRTASAISAVSAGALLLGVAGFALGHTIKSPSQLEAETNPPPASELTAEVRQGSLEEPIEFSGSVQWPALTNVNIATAQRTDGAIVTSRNVQTGGFLRAGSLLMTLSDRPVFLLPGSVPLYRSLTTGDTGNDVRRLQEGLKAAVDGSLVADGTFGAATSSALVSMYKRAGFSPPTENASEPGDVEQAQAPSERTTRSRNPGRHGRAAEPSVVVALPSELSFVSNLPARLVSFAQPVGASGESPVASVSPGSPVIKGTVSPDIGGQITVGMRARFTLANGRTGRGAITSVGSATPTKDQGFVVPLSLRPSKSLKRKAVGLAATSTIARRTQTSGLIVPVSALYATPGGRTYVRVVDDNNSRVVYVMVDQTSNGSARVVAAASSRPLHVGDVVVVGVSKASP